MTVRLRGDGTGGFRKGHSSLPWFEVGSATHQLRSRTTAAFVDVLVVVTWNSSRSRKGFSVRTNPPYQQSSLGRRPGMPKSAQRTGRTTEIKGTLLRKERALSEARESK
jgi:hypothetical protein